MNLFEWKKFSFCYGGSDRKVLNEINLTIEKSEFLLLCGSSGSGKSTFLRQMKKNLIPYGSQEGEIYYKGQKMKDVKARTDAAEIGFVMQDPEVQIVTDTVWHELAFGLESLGMEREVIHHRIAELVSFFGIEGWFHKKTCELSGGQKQLLNLASVMAMHPDILILDEPTAQLDPIAAENFIEMLGKINRELGTTILVSEHRLEELLCMADRVLLMEDGKIQIEGRPKEVGSYLASHREHSMFAGLPAALRIYGGLEQEISVKDCPLTVREGREWLRGFLQRRGIQFSDKIKERENLLYAAECSEAEEVLSAENLWFSYEKKGKDILKGTSLKMHKGECFAVLGGNGTGKSTFLKCLSGVLQPYRGKIKSRGKLVMLTQNPQALFTEITVEEELAEVFYGLHKNQMEVQREVEEMLERMHLSDCKKTHPYDLSGGEQQRLALGKLLLLKPDILLLDEPTKGLDPFLKKELAEILKQEVLETGGSVLMVSHDVNYCAEYADRCAMLFDGELLQGSTPEEFFGENYFYTTQANRIAKEYWKDAVTGTEVIRRCKEAMTEKK